MRLAFKRQPLSCSNHRAVWLHLCAIANHLAVRSGLKPHHRDDFVADFAEQMFCHRLQDLERYLNGDLPEAWLQKCARYALHNFLRSQAQVQRHEIQWPQTRDENGNVWDIDIIETAPIPHAQILHSELRQRLELAINALAPQNAVLFRRHFIEGATCAELAREANGSPDAMRKRLDRARASVAAHLKRQGLDKAQAMEYLWEMDADILQPNAIQKKFSPMSPQLREK
jgi:RNA polymerase sigma factor (sigma-70 family)